MEATKIPTVDELIGRMVAVAGGLPKSCPKHPAWAEGACRPCSHAAHDATKAQLALNKTFLPPTRKERREHDLETAMLDAKDSDIDKKSLW